MPTLQVRFEIYLAHPHFDPSIPNGPRFHRWLPNGIDDAIELLRRPDGTRLIAWFERLGVTDGLVRFDRGKREVDPLVLERQGHADAGPLLARLWWPVSDDELRALDDRMAKHPRTGPPPYPEPPEIEQICKKILRLAFDPLDRFVDVLRVTYGQYWLEGLSPFDSREHSAVEYVEQHLGAYDWSDDGVNWRRFPGGRITARMRARPLRDYRQFLTRDDWVRVAELTALEHKPSLGARLLSRAVQLLGGGHSSEALVQAAAGLEVVVSEFIEDRRQRGVDVKRLFPGFAALNDREKLTLCALMQSIDPNSVQSAACAIALRNEIVHEGKILPPELGPIDMEALRAAVDVGSRLCPSGPVRFVELFTTNAVLSQENWTRE